MIFNVLSFVIKILIKFRYKVEFIGLDKIKDLNSIAFLPNHPAFIDPFIIFASISKFHPRILIDERHASKPFINYFVTRINGIRLPDISVSGKKGISRVKLAIVELVNCLNNNKSILIYPSGKTYREKFEKVGANSGVFNILQKADNPHVVLVRTTGLWGSSLSYANTGKEPTFASLIPFYIKVIFVNFFIFIPKRKVTIEFLLNDSLMKIKDRIEFNQNLESFYNETATSNTFIPYYFWQGSKTKILDEFVFSSHLNSSLKILSSTRKIVFDRLAEVSGVTQIEDNFSLSDDLMMDSLQRAELYSWIENEFSIVSINDDSLKTVKDLLLVASGELTASLENVEVKVDKKWFLNRFKKNDPIDLDCSHNTITDIFLEKVKKHPTKVLFSDQTSGVKTYRDVIISIFALKRFIKELPGERVGIMLPASVGASVTYLTTLFSKKVPVMINWTVGVRTVKYAVESLNINKIITSKLLVDKLIQQGIDFSDIEHCFYFLEDVRPQINIRMKLSSLINGYVGIGKLKNIKVNNTSVVLFTSGSEGKPKAVPLTHQNQIANLKGALKIVPLEKTDSIMGFLPPFHSFGMLGLIALPIFCGIPVTYYPNPTETSVISKIISKFKTTILLGTPTFVNGILNASDDNELDSLKIVLTGAEKCPNYVYDALEKKCPDANILEGYGITECSPIISITPFENPIIGTIGKILDNIDYRILDINTQKDCIEDETGMLFVSGDSVFSGYLNYDGPSPFKEIDGKKYYKTGDLVKMKDGVLIFMGRLKRFEKIGGEMISLPAIEDVLLSKYGDSTSDGPVLAVENRGDDINVELVICSIIAIDRKDANQQIKQGGLSSLHQIRDVVQLKELPLLGTGKINYKELKNILRD